MKKIVLLLFVLQSCQSAIEKQVNADIELDNTMKSIVHNDSLNLFWNSKASNIIINKVSLASIYCHIIITNSSKKTIDAIRIGVLYFNAFGEPLNYTTTNFTPNFYDYEKKLNANDTTTIEIDSYKDYSSAKNGIAFIQKVHFTDGSIWENNENYSLR